MIEKLSENSYSVCNINNMFQGGNYHGRKKKKASAYREPLILIAFVILGAIIGMVMGEKASFLYPIGQIWLNLLFVLLVPLLFFSISSSIANISDTKSVGKLLGFTLVIFIVTAAIAGSFMFIVLNIFGVDTSVQLGAGDATAQAAVSSIGDQIVNTFTVGDFPDVISRGHILALIVFTVFFGVTVSSLGEKGREIANWLNNMSLVFYKMVAILMKAAPLGLMAYFANLTGTYGSDLLKSYGRGLLIYYPTVLVYFFVFLGLYAFIAAGPWGVKHYFKEILTPALTALGTRSSAAALPMQLDACDKLGVPRVVSSVVVSSVPGGGAAMETMLISSFGFPVIALPVLMMMTQLFDAGCTLINSCGDTVASMLVSRFLYGKDWYKRDLNKELAEAENKE